MDVDDLEVTEHANAIRAIQPMATKVITLRVKDIIFISSHFKDSS